MGPNPMQKMKRNSTLTGLIIGLMIGLVLCAFVYFFLSGTGGLTSGRGETITVYALNKEIKSGTAITAADLTPKVVSTEIAPANAVSLTGNTTATAKIDLALGTIITSSALDTSGTNLTADIREQEYNMITLPSQLAVNDFIDIRLQLPNGGDYIVISKKQVAKCNSSTIWLKMNEEEILTMSNAIIEYYIMPGSKLYATRYTEPGMQAASTPTYCPNSDVVSLINGNKNITTQIVDGEGRFTEALKNIRNSIINKEISNYSEEKLENIEEKIQKEIQTLKESREAYFGALNAAN